MSELRYKDNPMGKAGKRPKPKEKSKQHAFNPEVQSSELELPEVNKSSKMDCPLNKDSLGRATWSLLHTIASAYPEKPDYRNENDVMNFFCILSRIYPCPICGKGLQKKLREHPIDASSQKAFSQWLCKLHNKVNAKLGKPLFDCSKVDERWTPGVNKNCKKK